MGKGVGHPDSTITRTVLCIIIVNYKPIEWILKQFCDTTNIPLSVVAILIYVGIEG